MRDIKTQILDFDKKSNFDKNEQRENAANQGRQFMRMYRLKSLHYFEWNVVSFKTWHSKS